MGVIDREVTGKPLTLGDPGHLRAGKADYPARPRGLRRQQHMPGTPHVHRHDLLRAPGAVMGQRRQVHDRRAAPGRAADRGQVQDILALSTAEAGHLIPAAPQETCHRDADMTVIPRNQDPHSAIIPRPARPGAHLRCRLCRRGQGRARGAWRETTPG